MVEITSLIDNVKSDGSMLRCEHGLSLFVTYGGKRYLIDTGSSAAFIENATELGIDLTRLDGVIISHNHYDHIGGLKPLLKLNREVKIYIKRSAKGYFFSKRKSYNKYIGAELLLFTRYRDRFIFIDSSFMLSEGVYLLSNTINDEYFRAKDSRLLRLKGLKLEADRFDHELFMAIKEEDGVTIISSCSHNGIVNIIHSTKRLFSGIPIKGVVGGFHLKSLTNEMSPEQVDHHISDISRELCSSCSDTIYTCHCTGLEPFAKLEQKMGRRIAYLATGTTIKI